MEPEHDEGKEYDWASLTPSREDKFQDYVLLAHILLGIIISVLSFSNGWISWGTGTGAMTPFLLAVTGGIYAIHVGINWYRDEFIPYIARTQTIPEFETDRFLKYQRIDRVSLLIAGYFALVITQYAWTRIANFLEPIASDLISLLELLLFIFIGLIFFHVIVLFFFYAVFQSPLKSAFSDVSHIIDIEEKRRQYVREKQKRENEEKERQKKNLKKDKANKSESMDSSSRSSEEQE